MSESVLQVIGDDLKAEWGELKADANEAAVKVWGFVKGVVVAAEPTIVADAIAIAEKAVQMAESNEIGDIVQTMIEMGEVDGKDLLSTLGEDLLNVLASAAKLNAAKAAPAAA